MTLVGNTGQRVFIVGFDDSKDAVAYHLGSNLGATDEPRSLLY
jgi:hypothetical protein